MASGKYKAVHVTVARLVSADSGDRGPSIGVRRDEGAELGALVVRIKFIVYLFTDKLCQLTLALAEKQSFGIHVPSRTSSRVMIPRGMIAGSNICKSYGQVVSRE